MGWFSRVNKGTEILKSELKSVNHENVVEAFKGKGKKFIEI